MVMRPFLFATLITLVLGVERQVADWPQYLGPVRSGVYSGPALTDTWPAGGPPVLWRKAVGAGFSGPVVTGGRRTSRARHSLSSHLRTRGRRVARRTHGHGTMDLRLSDDVPRRLWIR